MYSTMILWFVSLMIRWTMPDATLGEIEGVRGRYVEIANAAVNVAFDPEEKPIFKGPLGRTKTSLLLLSIASYESHFEVDVETGKKRGDSGASWCLMQINIGNSRVKVDGDSYSYSKTEGWSGKDLVEDRAKCFRIALHMARMSYKWCGNLSVYATGYCYKHSKAAFERENRAKVSYEKEISTVVWKDVDVAGLLALNP